MKLHQHLAHTLQPLQKTWKTYKTDDDGTTLNNEIKTHINKKFQNRSSNKKQRNKEHRDM